MEVIELDIDDVFVDPNNANTHPEKSIQSIAASLKKWGQQLPILVDKDNVVIAGNGRLEVMRKLGYKTVRVVRSDLQGYDRMAYALADNQTAKFAHFDERILEDQLAALTNADIDFPSLDLGFDFEAQKWESNFDDVKNAEENEEGILARVKITCLQEDKEEILELIQKALKDIENVTIA